MKEKEQEEEKKEQEEEERKKELVQLVHEILQIKEEQEERMTNVNAKEEDTHKSTIEEMVEQILSKRKREDDVKERKREDTKSKDCAEKHESDRKKRRSSSLTKQEESEAHVEKGRRHADKGKITQEEKSSHVSEQWLGFVVWVLLVSFPQLFEKTGSEDQSLCVVKSNSSKSKIAWHSPNYIAPHVLTPPELFRFLTSHVSAFAVFFPQYTFRCLCCCSLSVSGLVNPAVFQIRRKRISLVAGQCQLRKMKPFPIKPIAHAPIWISKHFSFETIGPPEIINWNRRD